MTPRAAAAVEAIFALLAEKAALCERCPTASQIEAHLAALGHVINHKAGIADLAHAGRIVITVHGKNWRVVEIVGGPRTAPPPNNEKAYLRFDQNGRTKLTETPRLPARYTAATERGIAFQGRVAAAVSGASAPFARHIARAESIEMVAAALWSFDMQSRGRGLRWEAVQARTRAEYIGRATAAYDCMLNISRRNRAARDAVSAAAE